MSKTTNYQYYFGSPEKVAKVIIKADNCFYCPCNSRECKSERDMIESGGASKPLLKYYCYKNVVNWLNSEVQNV